MRFATHQENLQVSLNIVRLTRRLNITRNSNEALKAHFDHIFRIQEHQLGNQSTSDYHTMKAVPAHGNPLSFVSNEIDANELLQRNYEPNVEVLSWFKFREDFIYKSVLKKEKAISTIQNMFATTGNGSNDDLDLKHEQRVTLPVEYSLINGTSLPVSIVVESNYLPNLDASHSSVVNRIENYSIGVHSFLQIELLVEGTGRYRRFDIVICPFKIRDDYGYRNTVQWLLGETFSPITNQYGSRETQLLLVESHAAKILNDKRLDWEQLTAKKVGSTFFMCILRTSLRATASTYSKIEELDESYKLAYCPFCFHGAQL